MLANRRRDTLPEMRVRRILHARGLRFLVDKSPLGGRNRADIVFTRRRIVVFIDGCFWHSCPLHGVTPRTNASYWEPKLRRNAERDAEVNRALADAGWTVLRFWEHDDPDHVADMIEEAWRDAVRTLSPRPRKHGVRTQRLDHMPDQHPS